MHNRTEDWILESKYKNTRTTKFKSSRLLTILATVQKLQPLLKFKAKEGKDIEKKLQKLISAESKRVFAY